MRTQTLHYVQRMSILHREKTLPSFSALHNHSTLPTQKGNQPKGKYQTGGRRCTYLCFLAILLHFQHLRRLWSWCFWYLQKLHPPELEGQGTSKLAYMELLAFFLATAVTPTAQQAGHFFFFPRGIGGQQRTCLNDSWTSLVLLFNASAVQIKSPLHTAIWPADSG